MIPTLTTSQKSLKETLDGGDWRNVLGTYLTLNPKPYKTLNPTIGKPWTLPNWQKYNGTFFLISKAFKLGVIGICKLSFYTHTHTHTHTNTYPKKKHMWHVWLRWNLRMYQKRRKKNHMCSLKALIEKKKPSVTQIEKVPTYLPTYLPTE
jgi:hypothetical protein